MNALWSEGYFKACSALKSLLKVHNLTFQKCCNARAFLKLVYKLDRFKSFSFSMNVLRKHLARLWYVNFTINHSNFFKLLFTKIAIMTMSCWFISL